ncbi:MAG: hypothetical protein VW124_09795 [Paracoccaceae bacterium]
MSKTTHCLENRSNRIPRVAAIFALFVTTACVHEQHANIEGIGYREARFESLAAIRDYRQCRDEGLTFSKQARAVGNPGGYLTSARVLESCEAKLEPAGTQIEVDERMRTYALSIQNYLKGGDIARAQKSLRNFKRAFKGHDLYYPDGSSFVTTIDALLGQKNKTSFGQFSALNINPTVKSEMRRMFHWKNK